MKQENTKTVDTSDLSNWLGGADNKIFDEIEKVIYVKFKPKEKKEIAEGIFTKHDADDYLGIAHDICDYMGIERRRNRQAIRNLLVELHNKIKSASA